MSRATTYVCIENKHLIYVVVFVCNKGSRKWIACEHEMHPPSPAFALVPKKNGCSCALTLGSLAVPYGGALQIRNELSRKKIKKQKLTEML